MKDIKDITYDIATLCNLPAFYIKDGKIEVLYGGYLGMLYSGEKFYSFLLRGSYNRERKISGLKKPKLLRCVNAANLSFLVAILNREPMEIVALGPFFIEKAVYEETVNKLTDDKTSPFSPEAAKNFVGLIPAKDSIFVQSWANTFYSLLNLKSSSYIKVNTIFEKKSYRKEVHTIAENRMDLDEINSHYLFERKLKNLIRQGNSEKLHDLLLPKDKSQFNQMKENSILSNRQNGFKSLRSEKNLILIMNTIFRQSAGDAGLPPVYTHSISEDMTKSIEKAESSEELLKIIGKMIDSYCNSINNVALQNHSRNIVKAQRYILSNIDSEIKLDDLVEITGLDKSYLCRLFKRECHMTINEYITNQRVNEAKWILESTDKPITEIANLLGFSSQSYFCSVFKKTTGVSPAKYRMNFGGFYQVD